MSEELKPCPFCGGEARMLGGPMAQERYSVWCENRHHITGGSDAKKLALEWNTRSSTRGNQMSIHEIDYKNTLIEVNGEAITLGEPVKPLPSRWDKLSLTLTNGDDPDYELVIVTRSGGEK